MNTCTPTPSPAATGPASLLCRIQQLLETTAEAWGLTAAAAAAEALPAAA